MIDYKTNDPQGWGGDPSRGAALGRPTIKDANPCESIELCLKPVFLDGDYDENGTYFGAGAPLFWCADESGRVDFVVRAPSEREARRKVLESYPAATFRDASQAEIAEAMLPHYALAALWSSTHYTGENGDNDEPFDQNFSVADISEETKKTMLQDCLKFVAANATHLNVNNVAQAGHDFWLTRNGHGAGFNDRTEVWGAMTRRQLTESSQTFGTVDLYLGDDGKIYA